jgi:hypothetical protein
MTAVNICADVALQRQVRDGTYSPSKFPDRGVLQARALRPRATSLTVCGFSMQRNRLMEEDSYE